MILAKDIYNYSKLSQGAEMYYIYHHKVRKMWYNKRTKDKNNLLPTKEVVL